MLQKYVENLNERLLDLLLDDTCKNLREGVLRAPEPLHVDAASVFEKVCSVLRARTGVPIISTTASQITPLLVSSFGGNFVQMPDD